MTTAELRKFIGQVNIKYINKQETKEKTIADLQNINWNEVVESLNCPKQMLMDFVEKRLSDLNQTNN